MSTAGPTTNLFIDNKDFVRYLTTDVLISSNEDHSNQFIHDFTFRHDFF